MAKLKIHKLNVYFTSNNC